MADPIPRHRGSHIRTVKAIDLERFSGTPLGDLYVQCWSCSQPLSGPDKLCMINRERSVWFLKGSFQAFCEACTTAVVV